MKDYPDGWRRLTDRKSAKLLKINDYQVNEKSFSLLGTGN